MVKKSQVGLEYIIIAGFVTFILIGTLSIAFLYSGTINDRIRITQVENYANKVISIAESVFYSGSPSKATISLYLPDGVNNIEIIENSLVISTSTSSGLIKNAYSSKVPISGTLNFQPGLKRITILAEEDKVVISPA